MQMGLQMDMYLYNGTSLVIDGRGKQQMGDVEG